jgi:predicted dinucleotide-binding enzyme
MSVGFIGAGAIAQSVAALISATGTAVVLSNSRGPASLSRAVAGLGTHVRAGTVADAAGQDLVLLSVPWSRIPAALAPVPDWNGRILIDTTNPLEAPTFTKADLGGKTSSEVVASYAAGAQVVKAFNHLSPDTYRQGPQAGGGRRLLFVSGDEAAAKKVVLHLIKRIGFVGIDLGGLVTGGALHEFPGGPLPARNFIELG